MKRVVLTFGIIIGIIFSINMVIMTNMMMNKPDFEGNEVFGYTMMLIVLSLIFFGIRNFRNKYLGGYITFWQAFKTGLLISLIASTFYVVTWLVMYYNFMPDFMDRYVDHVVTNFDGTEAEKLKQIEKMDKMKEMYKNPIWVILFTYMEVLPISIGVSLISALILKKKQKVELA